MYRHKLRDRCVYIANTRYQVHTYAVYSCVWRLWGVFLEHGGGALGIFKSPVSTYNQSWTFVRFTFSFLSKRAAGGVCRPRSEAPCKLHVGHPKSCRQRTSIPSALRTWKPFSRHEAGLFVFLLPLPYPPASTSPGEGLPGGLSKGSCGRHKRRSMPNRLNIGMYARLLPAAYMYGRFKIRKCSHLLSDGGENTD